MDDVYLIDEVDINKNNFGYLMVRSPDIDEGVHK